MFLIAITFIMAIASPALARAESMDAGRMSLQTFLACDHLIEIARQKYRRSYQASYSDPTSDEYRARRAINRLDTFLRSVPRSDREFWKDAVWNKGSREVAAAQMNNKLRHERAELCGPHVAHPFYSQNLLFCGDRAVGFVFWLEESPHRAFSLSLIFPRGPALVITLDGTSESKQIKEQLIELGYEKPRRFEESVAFHRRYKIPSECCQESTLSEKTTEDDSKTVNAASRREFQSLIPTKLEVN